MGIYKDRVTIYEVAKAAGVSLATVSRVINNQSNVTLETKKRVEDTIARLGYKPNALAQGLATNRTTNIGIVIPDVNYVHISNLLSGMIDIGKIYGYQTTLFVTKHSSQDTKEVIAKLLTSHVDGAVVFDDELEQSDIETIIKYNIPLILIGDKFDIKDEKVGNITLNFASAIKEVINRHYENGGEKVTFLHSTNEGKMIQSIESKITHDLLKDSYDEMLVTDSYHETYLQFIEYFKKVKKGQFVCPRDSLACALTNAAIDSGLKVPEDIEVVSVIGTKYSIVSRPTISSCELDFYDVGSIAMRMVTKLLKDELKNRYYHFDARYNSRSSTRK
ncbi:MAG: LacI family DNA-binding transcriptional regulator [Erysipelotrichaceae bacterium]|nr:LacI family DNA-binding transcriptional regulator [Erysipelotrichaceae bacterium]